MSRRLGVLLRLHLSLQHRIADHAAQRKLVHIRKLPRGVRLLGQLLRLLHHVGRFYGEYCLWRVSLEAESGGERGRVKLANDIKTAAAASVATRTVSDSMYRGS